MERIGGFPDEGCDRWGTIWGWRNKRLGCALEKRRRYVGPNMLSMIGYDARTARSTKMRGETATYNQPRPDEFNGVAKRRNLLLHLYMSIVCGAKFQRK